MRDDHRHSDRNHIDRPRLQVPHAGAAGARILEWSRDRFGFKWVTAKPAAWLSSCATGTAPGHLFVSLPEAARSCSCFRWLRNKDPFDEEGKREQFRDRLNEIDGVDIPAEALTGNPRVSLTVFAAEGALDTLFRTLEWFIEEVRKSPANSV